MIEPLPIEERFQEVFNRPESQGQNLALTVIYVPRSLASGIRWVRRISRDLAMMFSVVGLQAFKPSVKLFDLSLGQKTSLLARIFHLKSTG